MKPKKSVFACAWWAYSTLVFVVDISWIMTRFSYGKGHFAVGVQPNGVPQFSTFDTEKKINKLQEEIRSLKGKCNFKIKIRSEIFSNVFRLILLYDLGILFVLCQLDSLRTEFARVSCRS